MEKGVIDTIKIEGVKGEGAYNYDLSDNKWHFCINRHSFSYCSNPIRNMIYSFKFSSERPGG